MTPDQRAQRSGMLPLTFGRMRIYLGGDATAYDHFW